MIRLIRNTIKRSQRGFTLVEMAVVIAILGVLAAVATPLLVNYLGGAKERAYEKDLGTIQTALDAAFSAPNNDRFLGKNQYAILGRDKTTRAAANANVRTASFPHPDDAAPLTANDWNPLGGIQGANLFNGAGTAGTAAAWTDDGDSVREVQSASPDTWTTIKVTREAIVYYVDSRYYFVDMARLVTDGFLKETPKSSSVDNSAGGTGSYIYYVDDKGKVQTFAREFPKANGFVSGVYP